WSPARRWTWRSGCPDQRRRWGESIRPAGFGTQRRSGAACGLGLHCADRISSLVEHGQTAVIVLRLADRNLAPPCAPGNGNVDPERGTVDSREGDRGRTDVLVRSGKELARLGIDFAPGASRISADPVLNESSKDCTSAGCAIPEHWRVVRCKPNHEHCFFCNWSLGLRASCQCDDREGAGGIRAVRDVDHWYRR